MADKQDMNIALLIDSDNVSAKYISNILSVLSKYGKITIRRMYGDWSQDRLKQWLHCSASYSLEPIMQMNNTPGKNASDIGLIIDAMDILYRNTVDGFCIASSDGDFNKLAKRLREAGKMVIGMGERKTPEAFRVSCERFIFLDVDSEDDSENSSSAAKTKPAAKKKTAAKTTSKRSSGTASAGASAGSTSAAAAAPGSSSAPGASVSGFSASAQPVFSDESASHRADSYRTHAIDTSFDEDEGSYGYDSADVPSFTPREAIERTIIDIIDDNNADGKDTSLGEIGQRLATIYPDFDTRNYGYSKLTSFVKDLPRLQMTSHDNAQWVSLKGSSDGDIEQQIIGIFRKHGTRDLDIGLLKQELSAVNPNLDDTIRKSGVTRFNVYLNRNIHSVEVNGPTVTLLV
ncbi:MAG: NYN domain-containing protein [Lachnospiraceae bacterium]|jgi:uncharacterized protein (TIGR00288 family)|nr:NYN domain-containing protein [Lachnospiraceae bacterium]MCH4029085.1 NYN domain-containing protein [Lachnospiraceae bacterium]MCH4066941.1 NYN domain-containing protein [Lachnospiraceae bacterium]MCH4112966.1 NYN domain-containing protein [Lachnospiraceae bacterium]MCI1352493.1 NYN domain-containing protein [Lachnospiraceae bacterium]